VQKIEDNEIIGNVRWLWP